MLRIIIITTNNIVSYDKQYISTK